MAVKIQVDNVSMLHDNVLVRPDPEEEKTAGGVMLPDSAKKKPTTGTVVAVGPGAVSGDGKLLPMSVVKGATVLYRKWAANEIEVGGETLFMMKDSDLIAKVTS